MSHTIGQAKQDNQQSNSNSNSSQASQDSKPEAKISKPVSPLTDADYEFLFNQLLEGIAHGWHDQRIAKFFNQLGERGKQQDWVAWLERLRVRLLTLPIPSKRQMGTMMIRLGELTQFTSEVNQIGVISNQIGRELLFGDTEDIIWEYTGPDLMADASTTETEQNLSERLPTDFSELGSSAIEDRETNLSSAPDVSSEQTVENDLIDSGANQSDIEQLNEQSEEFLVDPELDLSLSLTEEQASDLLKTLESEPSKDNLSSDTPETDASPTAKQQDPDPVAIDMQQVMNLIQEDEELAEQISKKLNVPLHKVDNLAVEEVEQSDEIQANDLDRSSLELIESWFNLGLKQVSAGEFVKAIASWEKALKINPNLSEAWHNRGSALGRLGEYEEAVESFQSALAIDPYNYQAWNDRAHALYQMQKWSEAVNSWNNAIKIMPGNHLFWYNRGCALEQLENWDESIASYEKSLEIKPDFQPARSRYTNLVADKSRSN